MSSEEQGNRFIQNSIQEAVEHWRDEISFLEDRLNGRQGDIDEEDRSSCLEALEIARENLADAITHSQKSVEKK